MDVYQKFTEIAQDPAIHALAPEKDVNICVGKEWYRFPSNFFLPGNKLVWWYSIRAIYNINVIKNKLFITKQYINVKFTATISLNFEDIEDIYF